MNELKTQPAEAQPTSSVKDFCYRQIVLPLLNLLRMGATPRKLAWSLAVGVAVGMNPLLGSTTIACLAIAFLLRLNLIASQITNHLVYPLQLLLFLVFIRVGDLLFHTGALPLEMRSLFYAARHHPWATTKLLWTWEWHALTVWFAFALILTPILAFVFAPLLERLMRSPRFQTSPRN
jgi:uncharacterized protein (DUF2062 family)